MNIYGMQKAMSSGETTSRRLVIDYMQRIAEIDSCENGLNSIAYINPDALSIADNLDIERGNGQVRGPMHGIPVVIKENINTGDKIPTTGGSLSLKNNFAPEDAGVAVNLRKAGAVILGKTNMTEFANYMTQGMPGGYSSRGGQVLCPYDRKVNPSGSSAGSAVAVAAELSAVSIGTETSGSIVCPARINGIVGIKPTARLIPGDGIIPISGTLDTAGPMAKSVSDAAVLLEAMTGRQGVYTKGLRSFSLDGVRIGINRANMKSMNKERLDNFEKMYSLLEEAGAILVEDINILFRKEVANIFKYEYKNALNSYLSKLRPSFSIKTLQNIVEFNKQHKDKALKYGQKYMLDALYYTSGSMKEPAYLEALGVRESLIDELDSLMLEKQLDLIIQVNEYSNISSLSGYPALTLPTGIGQSGIPAGIKLMTRHNEDALLIKAAYAIESVLELNLVPADI